MRYKRCSMFTFLSHIEINPSVQGGKAVIKGTDIRVSELLKRLDNGESWKDIFARYPVLTETDMYAALFYAGYNTCKDECSL
jgi:uncharacterized protein (DUF433 family)